MTTTLITMPARLAPHAIAGLRMNWIQGEDETTGMTFDLDTGAGLGSPALTLTVRKPDGTRVIEVIDITKIATDWVQQILATWPEPAENAS